MTKIDILTFTLLILILGGCGSDRGSRKKPEYPNIIVFYVDDMGIGDVACAGGKVAATPNIDRLAREGKIFTQYYTDAPVCSPSRVALTTGMNHIRWNINTYLSTRELNRKQEQSDYLDPKAPSLARSLKSADYITAHFGKWHMGGGRDVKNAPSISEYGFDEFSSTWESPEPDPLLTSSDWIWSATDSIKRWERTAYFIDKTLNFLKSNPDQPCFINLWPDDIHSPWVASAELKQEDIRENYTLERLLPVLDEFDAQVGRLIKGIKDLGFEKNTLVIFTSDNGPSPSFNRLRTNGLRGVKNSLYEGGILMPFIAHWPGTIDSGQVDSTSIIGAVDLFPTLCMIGGAALPADFELDGEDISKAITSNEIHSRKKDLFFEYGRNEAYGYPHDSTDRSPQLCIRRKEWKLLTTPGGDHTELYKLSVDPKERTNLASSRPDIVKQLKPGLIEWYNKHDKEYLLNIPPVLWHFIPIIRAKKTGFGRWNQSSRNCALAGENKTWNLERAKFHHGFITYIL